MEEEDGACVLGEIGLGILADEVDDCGSGRPLFEIIGLMSVKLDVRGSRLVLDFRGDPARSGPFSCRWVEISYYLIDYNLFIYNKILVRSKRHGKKAHLRPKRHVWRHLGPFLSSPDSQALPCRIFCKSNLYIQENIS